MNLKVDKLLSVFLSLVALHSIVVGLGLILLSSSFFQLLGFEPTCDRFFSTQGGVFHIAMSFCYSAAALNVKRFENFIQFSIIVKFIATVFLVIYYFFISDKLIIILSGVSDFVMGIVILLLYNNLKKDLYFDKD